jgi:multidrug transporter EmrE-like cation transporter
MATSIALIVVSVCFAVAGQLTLKSAMQHAGRIEAGELKRPAAIVVRVAKQPRLWAGLVLFGVSSFFWLVVLSRVPLSLAYPFVGISYILIVSFSRFVLHEQVPVLRWAGVAVIATGIVLVGLSFVRQGH